MLFCHVLVHASSMHCFAINNKCSIASPSPPMVAHHPASSLRFSKRSSAPSHRNPGNPNQRLRRFRHLRTSKYLQPRHRTSTPLCCCDDDDRFKVHSRFESVVDSLRNNATTLRCTATFPANPTKKRANSYGDCNREISTQRRRSRRRSLQPAQSVYPNYVFIT